MMGPLYKNEGWKKAMRQMAYLVDSHRKRRHRENKNDGIYWVQIDPEVMHVIVNEMEWMGRIFEHLAQFETQNHNDLPPSLLIELSKVKQFAESGPIPSYRNYGISYESLVTDKMKEAMKQNEIDEHNRTIEMPYTPLLSKPKEPERVTCICRHNTWAEIDPETKKVIKTESKLEVNKSCKIHGGHGWPDGRDLYYDYL